MPKNVPPTKLALSLSAAVGKKHVPFINRHLRKAHTLLNPPLRELSLAFVGDRHMAELHVQFLNLPGPTDVLTFPLETDRRGRPTAGEVVVCVPEAARRAKEHGVSVERELLLYCLHGLLHLCGHDDKTAAGFRRMHRAEDRILTQLGVGPTFVPEPSPVEASPKRTPRRKPK